MQKIIAPIFILFVSVALAYAFSPRPVPQFHDNDVRIEKTLILDAEHAGDQIVAIGDGGLIFTSVDHGFSWQNTASPTNSTLTGLFFLDEKNGWAVGHDSVILHTTDGGNHWEQVYAAPAAETPLMDIWFADASRGYAVGAYGLFMQTTDGGLSWDTRQIIEDDRHLNSIISSADGTLFIAGETGTLLRSADNGLTWVKLMTPYNGSFFGMVALTDNSLMIYGMRGNILRTENLGASFAVVKVATKSSLFGGQTVSDTNQPELVIVGQAGTLLTSNDEGQSFSIQKMPGNVTLTTLLSTKTGTLGFGQRGVTVIPTLSIDTL